MKTLILKHTAYSLSKKDKKIKDKDKLKPQDAMRQLKSTVKGLKVDPEAVQLEGFIGVCNTPMQGDGYFRVIVEDAVAEEIILAGGIDGATYVPDEPMWSTSYVDEGGQEIFQQHTLGVFAGVSNKEIINEPLS